MKKIFITGTSRGLGRSLAEEFTRRGNYVIASARNINDLKDLDAYKKISLDVTDEEQIKKTVDECGVIDVLMNNAAYSVAGPLEAIPIEEIRNEYETGVIGPLRLIKAFVPGMRNAGKGIIVNISSISDRFAPPYGGSYSSAKSALAMMSEALHFELGHFGIKVILIEAGAIKTDLPLRQKQFTSEKYHSLEKQMKIRAEKYFSQDKRPEPSEIAKMIADAVLNTETGFRVPIGKDAEYMVSLHRSLNDTEWEKQSPLKQGLDW